MMTDRKTHQEQIYRGIQVMSDVPRYSHETKEFYFRKRHFPHCGSCTCSNSEIKVLQSVKVPSKAIRRVSSHVFQPRIRTCVCDDLNYIKEEESCTCLLCAKTYDSCLSLFCDCHSAHWDQHHLLENWFRRFDCNRDGYLDLTEFQSLLKHLGSPLQMAYAKRLLMKADLDNDGRLSFPEFLHMWQHAAMHEDEYRKATGCSCIHDIIKQYHLYPMEPSPMKHCCSIYLPRISNQHPIGMDLSQRPHTDSTTFTCNCGKAENVIPFRKLPERVLRKRSSTPVQTEIKAAPIQTSKKRESEEAKEGKFTVEIKKEKTSSTQIHKKVKGTSSETMPLLSSNRDSVSYNSIER